METNEYLISLVETIRNTKDKAIEDLCFEQLVEALQDDLWRLSRYHAKFCNGQTHEDLYQEALLTLKTKCIPAFDIKRGIDGKQAKVVNFFTLVIKRHLITIYKRGLAQKASVLNLSRSYDTSHNSPGTSEFEYTLKDFLVQEDNLFSTLTRKEWNRKMTNLLLPMLTPLEKRVFLLYIRGFSYEEISIRLARLDGEDISTPELLKKKVRCCDNSLMRIRKKGLEVSKKVARKEASEKK